jgi:hypothetical protein
MLRKKCFKSQLGFCGWPRQSAWKNTIKNAFRDETGSSAGSFAEKIPCRKIID